MTVQSEADAELAAILVSIGLLHPVPNACSWMIGSWGRSAMYSRAPSWFRFSGSAQGNHKVVEGTFFCQNTLHWFLHPHYTRWWGGVGVLGLSSCGACDCDAFMPTKCRNHPRSVSRACKFISALMVKAYNVAGQAISSLHAMAILKVYQAK